MTTAIQSLHMLVVGATNPETHFVVTTRHAKVVVHPEVWQGRGLVAVHRQRPKLPEPRNPTIECRTLSLLDQCSLVRRYQDQTIGQLAHDLEWPAAQHCTRARHSPKDRNQSVCRRLRECPHPDAGLTASSHRVTRSCAPIAVQQPAVHSFPRTTNVHVPVTADTAPLGLDAWVMRGSCVWCCGGGRCKVVHVVGRHGWWATRGRNQCPGSRALRHSLSASKFGRSVIRQGKHQSPGADRETPGLGQP